MAVYARQCERCGRIIAPRGDQTPRFCAVCGFPLDHADADGADGPTGSTPAPPGVAPERRSGLAIAALVLGIISIFLIGKLSVGAIAVLCGIAARQHIAHAPERLSGAGAALAGIALGAIGIAMSLVAHGPVGCLLFHPWFG